MNSMDDLTAILKRLRLSGILTSLDIRCRQAVEDNMAHRDFLFRLLLDEAERRDALMLEQRIKKANFEEQARFEDFDFGFNPKIPKATLVDLATCVFIMQKQNVLLLGYAGVGKSHIAQSLGQRACRQGRSVLFVEASAAFKQLRAARADGTHEKRLQKLKAPELLIIDDLGLLRLTSDDSNDLYEIIRYRHRKSSTLITSNRDLDELPKLFHDPLLASTAMDRLLEQAHVVKFEGDSYRNPPAERRGERRPRLPLPS